MDLRSEILKEHSKAQSTWVKAWIGNDRKRFHQLLQLFLHDEYRVVQRSAWIISLVAGEHPKLIEPYLGQIIQKMHEPGVHVAVKRNVVRILQHLPIPEELQGIVLNTCFDLLADPGETIAVRAFSMTVLANLSKVYPEIRQELKIIVSDVLAREPSAGFKARARRLGL